MNKTQALERLKYLKEQIEYHNKKYYEDDDPEIEDWEYDKLVVELEELRDQFHGYYEPKVGGRASEKFSKVKHQVKMESLHDSFSIEELFKFYNRVDPDKTQEFVIEPKIDGISLSVEYTNGVLTCASTRGDGYIGEDITENALTIKNLPHKIKTDLKHLEIRGECFMPKADFEELNKTQKLIGGKIFKNPRNAAAGSIRQKDAGICKSRNLQILFFNVQMSDKKFKTHSESLKFIKSLGLPTVDFKLCNGFDEIKEKVGTLWQRKHKFTFQADGAVLKINSIDKRIELGSTSAFPRWAEALKYPPQVKKTRCTDIKLGVGRTGIITPVCIFEPVNLDGSCVSKASLHNIDFIKLKDIRIGDFVFVNKSGDIIPEIVKCEHDLHNKNPEFKVPDNCPSCGSKLAFEKDGNSTIIKCKNENCFEKIKAKILHFISRGAMNIKKFGEETINILKNEINSYADIYKLNANILSKYKQFIKPNSSHSQTIMSGFDIQHNLNKTGKNLLDEINKSKSNSLERLIYGIGIPFVGKETAKIISKHFKNLGNLQKATLNELIEISSIGAKTAKSIFEFLSNKQNIENLNLIKTLGVNTKI